MLDLTNPQVEKMHYTVPELAGMYINLTWMHWSTTLCENKDGVHFLPSNL